MQPLGGRFRKDKAGKNRRRRGRASGGSAASRFASGVLLKTSASWRGASQRFGARRLGADAGGLSMRGPWRAATAVFLVATSVYGIVAGGYIERAAGHLSRRASDVVALAGFTITQLTIVGQNRTSDGDVVKALALGSRQFAITFDSAAAQSRLERLPWVRHAQVMRLLPSRLHIVLEERRPFAIWQHDGKTHLIDAEGVAIAPAAVAEYPGLPFVVGAGAAREANELYELLSGRSRLKGRVRAAVRVADRRWTLKLDTGVEIRLPEENLAYAIAKVEQLDNEHGILSGEVTVVDLRLPGRVTLRLTEEAAARRDAAFARRPAERQPGQDT